MFDLNTYIKDFNVFVCDAVRRTRNYTFRTFSIFELIFFLDEKKLDIEKPRFFPFFFSPRNVSLLEYVENVTILVPILTVGTIIGVIYIIQHCAVFLCPRV